VTAVLTAGRTTAPPPSEEGGGRLRLVFGLIGRAWLWFVVGCLLVTLVPLVFGWRPYVVQSGSMEPRISVGDVVLASPVTDREHLLGRVTVFEAPDDAGKVITHRVVRFDGSAMVTKGDANATVDSAAITMGNVRGLGRLLVRWVGLPLLWLQTGQWLWLLLLAASLLASAVAIARDHEDESEPAASGQVAGSDPLSFPPSVPRSEP